MSAPTSALERAVGEEARLRARLRVVLADERAVAAVRALAAEVEVLRAQNAQLRAQLRAQNAPLLEEARCG